MGLQTLPGRLFYVWTINIPFLRDSQTKNDMCSVCQYIYLNSKEYFIERWKNTSIEARPSFGQTFDERHESD